MAKKPSSKARKGKRPVEKSAVNGGGIMSINKSTASTVATATDPISKIKATYDSQVKSLNTVVASDPTSYTVLISLGNTHYDYALQLMQASQTTTAAMIPALEQWTLAKESFAKAFKKHALEKAPAVDYSVAQYYSGETTAAIKTAVAVTKIDPNYAPAHYNLAIFYDGRGDKALAIKEYQLYIVLDPKGQFGSPSYAVAQLKALGGSVPATTTGLPSAASSGTTP